MPCLDLLAQIYQKQGKMEEAEQILQKAVRLSPRVFERYEPLLDVLETNGKVDEMVQLIEVLERAQSGTAEEIYTADIFARHIRALIIQIQEAENPRQKKELLEKLERVVEQNPRRFDALKMDPNVRKIQEVARSAIKILAGKVSDGRNVDDILASDLQKSMQSGDIRERIEAYESLIQLFPKKKQSAYMVIVDSLLKYLAKNDDDELQVMLSGYIGEIENDTIQSAFDRRRKELKGK